MIDRERPGYRRLVLAMLLLVYTFNFLDRQILGILAKPIQQDLGLDDAQFGAIGGIAFALLYSCLGVPLALLADRVGKTKVIGASLVVWSAFTALCGVAGNFWHLFLYRLGVGVGEAGGVAPSYALIADYYPIERRARALAVYSMGIPIGVAFGVLLGAYIAALINWRVAFMIVGIAGIVIAPFFLWLVQDRPHPAPVAAVERTPLFAVFPILAAKPAFWLMALGAGCSSLAGYGLALWVPKILMLRFDWGLITVGQFMGSLLLIGGASGVFLGGVLADRLGRGDRGWYVKLPAYAWLVTAPTFALGLLSPSPMLAWACLLIPNALNIMWLGPINTAVQNLAPPQMRASASGAFLFINNLIGLGIGPWLLGAISVGLKAQYGDDSLRYAAIIGVGFYVVAAVLGLLAVRSLRRGWIEQPA
ncbi:spinster family MFS transporter [Sphingomonas sp. TX0543]|uniref:spinster family MFS transporter n=1 Tax=unclassified Sphingomonas TaxID=196159 RepID=UPI0010FA01CB|nr:MFS transporter [Sphingomonas sp. 3P27F8]